MKTTTRSGSTSPSLSQSFCSADSWLLNAECSVISGRSACAKQRRVLQQKSSTMKTQRFLRFGLVAVLWLVWPVAVSAINILVNNTNDIGVGSLRAAIIGANATRGTNAIVFAIPGPGPHTIRPLTRLPDLAPSAGLTNRLIIDGYTQPNSSSNTLPNGNNAILMIELDGSLAGANADGLTIAGSRITIRGLAINRFSRHGIVKFGGSGAQTLNFIEGCFIGTDVTGTVNRGNGGNGIDIDDATSLSIGGFGPVP